MSLPITSGYLVNDPGHAPRAAPWLLGMTPLRFAAVLALSMLVAARPAFFGHGGGPIPIEDFLASWFRLTGRFFIAALPMFVLVVKVEAGTARWPAQRRIAALVAAVIAGAVAYAALVHLDRVARGVAIAGDPRIWLVHGANFTRAVVTGGLMTAILFFAAREREAQQRLHAAGLGRVETGRQAAEVRLNLLQAQIEPHFLFNSLASVKRLYEREPNRGRELLANLREYLRAAVSSGRGAETTLGQEVALARSYLAIFQVRMGWRLRASFELPPGLERAIVPPLMLGTLVENAIKHGLAPRATGGVIAISARRVDQRLEVEVRDDGVGFRTPSGHGVGLANTRARLHTLFGDAGELELSENARGGVTSSLTIPLRLAPGAEHAP